MKNLLTLLTLATSLSFLSLDLQAQKGTPTDCEKWSIGMHYNFIKPLSTLRTNGFSANHGGNFGLFYLGFKSDGVQIQPGLKVNIGTSAGNVERINTSIIGPADRKTHNFLLDLKASTRFIFPTDHVWSVYADGNIGLRTSWGRETYRPIDNFNGEENTAVDFSATPSFLWALNAGVLYPISDMMDLDFRINFEGSNEIGHYDLSDNAYPQVQTGNAIDLGLAIGVRIRLGCGNDAKEERERRYTPSRNKRTKVIKKR